MALFGLITVQANTIDDFFTKTTVEGALRAGGIEIKDDAKNRTSTLALGGKLGIKTASIKGVGAGITFYTTNALLGKNDEAMFLSSESKSYSIVGEAYLQAEFGNSSIKVGRQILDTPYADSDDIGMVPNTFEGASIINQDIQDTTVIVASLNKWAGVDSSRAQVFSHLQDSGDDVLMVGAIYEGLENSTLQAWHYKLDNANFNYVEAGYECEAFSVGAQYTSQDHGNHAYGLNAAMMLEDLMLTTAYNKVQGVVSNGFGGGPFFTSSEDHTIADIKNQEAKQIGLEYGIGDVTLALSHVIFKEGEDETDYLLSYALNEQLTVDVIHSQMYADGQMTRLFANYNF